MTSSAFSKDAKITLVSFFAFLAGCLPARAGAAAASFWGCAAALALAAAPSPAFCDAPLAVATPAAPTETVSAEDEYSPSYYGENGDSNTVNLRLQLPSANARWLLRLKLPIVTAAPPESVPGRGDLAIWDLAVLNAGHGQWLVGPTLRLPVANDSLGSHKYSIGPAFGYAQQAQRVTYGFFAQAFFSVIGPSSYPPVEKADIAPTLKVDLAGGWNVGLSTMQFTYDWARNRWTDVPLGFRIGKSSIAELKPLDAYFELERNLAHTADTPGWTMRLLTRWNFGKTTNSPSDADQDE